MAVVRRKSDGKFLLVQEFCSSGYWLPGGGVDPGEDLDKAAIRETLEEAGVEIELKGILRMEYSPKTKYSRLRVIFYGEPVDDSARAKTIPDFESVGACWVSIDDLSSLGAK